MYENLTASYTCLMWTAQSLASVEEEVEGPPGTLAQRSRNDHATITLTEPPVLPPLQGQRPVSAPPRTAAKAEQAGEALKHCLDAVSTAFTVREVS